MDVLGQQSRCYVLIVMLLDVVDVFDASKADTPLAKAFSLPILQREPPGA